MDEQSNYQQPQRVNEPPVQQPVTQPTPQPQPQTNVPAKRSKAGLVLLWLLIILLLVGIAGVYEWQHKKVSELQAQLNTGSSSKQFIVKHPLPPVVNSSTQYLYLYDYGLKIPLTKDIEDLYYVNYKSSSNNILSFSTQSLANYDFACLAEPANGYVFSYLPASATNPIPTASQEATINGSPLGVVTVTSSALPQNQVGSLDSQVGVFEAHTNSYYLYYKSPQAGCTTNNIASTLELQQKQSLLTALKGTESIN